MIIAEPKLVPVELSLEDLLAYELEAASRYGFVMTPKAEQWLKEAFADPGRPDRIANMMKLHFPYLSQECIARAAKEILENEKVTFLYPLASAKPGNIARRAHPHTEDFGCN